MRVIPQTTVACRRRGGAREWICNARDRDWSESVRMQPAREIAHLCMGKSSLNAEWGRQWAASARASVATLRSPCDSSGANASRRTSCGSRALAGGTFTRLAMTTSMLPWSRVPSGPRGNMKETVPASTSRTMDAIASSFHRPCEPTSGMESTPSPRAASVLAVMRSRSAQSSMRCRKAGGMPSSRSEPGGERQLALTSASAQEAHPQSHSVRRV